MDTASLTVAWCLLYIGKINCIQTIVPRKGTNTTQLKTFIWITEALFEQAFWFRYMQLLNIYIKNNIAKGKIIWLSNQLVGFIPEKAIAKSLMH